MSTQTHLRGSIDGIQVAAHILKNIMDAGLKGFNVPEINLKFAGKELPIWVIKPGDGVRCRLTRKDRGRKGSVINATVMKA